MDANPTFSLEATYGLSSTYKSKMVVNNDTGSSISYSLGGSAGDERQFSFFIKTYSNSTDFELNDSSIKTMWRDSIIRYRFYFLYFGAAFSQVEIEANREGTDILDAAGSGICGNVGMQFSMGRAGHFYLDFLSGSMSKVRNALDDEVKIESRSEIDVGMGFDVTKKLIDFIVGYRQNSLTIKITDSYKETLMTTYLGFRFAGHF